MSEQSTAVNRLALAVAVEVTAILAREAETRQEELDRRLQPMRQVIDALEYRYGPNVHPLEHPGDFADLIVRHQAGHLRERDVQMLAESIDETLDRDDALSQAIGDLDDARDDAGETELLAWVGVSRQQFMAAVDTALRRQAQFR